MVLDLRLPDMSVLRFSSASRHSVAQMICRSSFSPAKRSYVGGRRALAPLARKRRCQSVESPSGCSMKRRLPSSSHRGPTAREAKDGLIACIARTMPLVGKKCWSSMTTVRNIFALSSVLERRGMACSPPEPAAKRSLPSSPRPGSPSSDDLMMPEMTATKPCRSMRQNLDSAACQSSFDRQRMKGDREKCLEAGACGISRQPVNTEQLFPRCVVAASLA